MGPVRNLIPPVLPVSSVTNPPPCRQQHDVGETVQRLLNPSEKDCMMILELLDALGCSSVGDLAFLHDSDFDDSGASSVPPMQQRKLLLVSEFVRRGGKVEEVDDLGQLVQQVDCLRQVPAVPTPPIQSTSGDPKEDEGEEEEIVKLDVGGFPFKTTRKTLTSVPGSFFDAMLSGRHENPATQMEDGTYFIDRNGSMFDQVLNFLRHRDVVSLPQDTTEQETLAAEALFYGLDQLVHAIEMPKIDITACLSDEMVKIWDNEEEQRTAYRTKKAEDFTPDDDEEPRTAYRTMKRLDFKPYQGLVPLFSPDDSVQSLPLKYDPPEKTESVPLIINIHGKILLKKNQSVSVGSLNAFRSNFNQEHANVLHRLNDILLEEPVIIAGGSVLRALTVGDQLRPFYSWKGKSDIDIFLYAASPSEANRISRRIFYALAVDHERWVIVRSRGVITMHSWTDGAREKEVDQKVQIVLQLYESPAEVLIGFDVDCCCCAYDGREVWASARCLRAIRSRTNVLNPLHAWPNRPSYELRLGKYGARGFAIAVPGLDEKRIDNERIRQQTLDKLKGLARLLKVSFTMEKDATKTVPETPLCNGDLKVHAVADMGDCDILIAGRAYDHGTEGVIVPRVYCNGDPQFFHWQTLGSMPTEFPRARDVKDGAWAEIENAEGTDASVERVPDRLLDAWDTKKRSREHLNSESMLKFDLDNQYYGHAYEKTG